MALRFSASRLKPEGCSVRGRSTWPETCNHYQLLQRVMYSCGLLLHVPKHHEGTIYFLKRSQPHRPHTHTHTSCFVLPAAAILREKWTVSSSSSVPGYAAAARGKLSCIIEPSIIIMFQRWLILIEPVGTISLGHTSSKWAFPKTMISP